MAGTIGELVTFTVGLIIGALGTVALFRTSLGILQTQVAHLATSVGELKNAHETLERDMNRMGDKIRAEIRTRKTER